MTKEPTIINELPAATEEVVQRKLCSRTLDEASPNFGLLDSISYVFDETGFIDWRVLIPKGFLFINQQKFKELGKEVPKTMDGLEDSMIIIKLGGIKWLARVRGYEKVMFEVISASPENVVVKCIIDWIPNIENPLGASYEEIASCNAKNAVEFNIKFAESIAANRAFVRCVRNFLNVNIVGEEEIFEKEADATKTDVQSGGQVSVDPQSIFMKNAKEKGMTILEIIEFCYKNDSSIVGDMLRGMDEAAVVKALTPKQAKKLLKAIKKA